MKRNRILLITLLILVALFSSMLFIVLESDHHCAGIQCTVCTHLSVCKNILRQLALCAGAAGVAINIIYLLLYKTRGCRPLLRHETLITYKVKLSN